MALREGIRGISLRSTKTLPYKSFRPFPTCHFEAKREISYGSEGDFSLNEALLEMTGIGIVLLEMTGW